MKLKILSWNIWGGRYLSEIIKFLDKADADIIGLQEVVQDLNGENNTAQIIAEKLGYKWVFYLKGHAYFYGSPREWGNAILSKYDIVSHESYNLFEGEDNRIAVEAEIQVKNKTLHVFSTHLIHTHQKPSQVQEMQAKNLIKVLPKENTILMGDFNATPKSVAMQKIKKVMIDSDPASKSTWSVYPEGCIKCNPQKIDTRLDYIFITKDIKTHFFKVENSKGSDHLPISVIAET